MVSFLTDSQRGELHESIVGYLRAQHAHAALIAQVSETLSVSAPEKTDATILERKWAALVRLQKKILELEQMNAQLQAELKASRGSVNAPAPAGQHTEHDPLASYLPKFPPKFVLEGHRGRIPCVEFHPKYSLVASGCEDGSIKIWDYEQGEIERTIMAHTRGVQGVVFSPISGTLVSASADLSVKAWAPDKQFANVRTMLGHDHSVSAVTTTVLGPTNKEYVLSASRDKTVRVWELSTGFLVDVLRYHSDWVRTVDATQNKQGEFQHILSAGSDRVVMLSKWGDNSDSGLRKYAGHRHVIECCRFAPQSSHRFIAKQYPELARTDLCFASAGRDNLILVWASSNTENPIMTLVGHDNWIQGLAFHPSGRFLVSVSDDKSMRIWDLANARLIRTLPAHDHFVSCIAWHNRSIVTGSVDQTVKIW